MPGWSWGNGAAPSECAKVGDTGCWSTASGAKDIVSCDYNSDVDITCWPVYTNVKRSGGGLQWVQGGGCVGTTSGTTVTSTSCTVPVVGAGHSLFCVGVSSGGTLTVTDDKNGAYTTTNNLTSGGQSFATFVRGAINDGPSKITLNLGGSHPWAQIACDEATTAVNVAGNSANMQSPPPTTPDGVTSKPISVTPGETLWGVSVHWDGSVAQPGTGFTKLHADGPGNWGIITETAPANAAGSK